jgi:pimeloyl-ACP methyl ester carboxylesterase
VAEWGDPDGSPLITLHGTPGSRLGHWRDPGIYARYGLRRITYDRAGYGGSTRLAGRTIADVTGDVAAIADALGIGSFAISGGSGGGPHALACAALLGDRVTLPGSGLSGTHRRRGLTGRRAWSRATSAVSSRCR